MNVKVQLTDHSEQVLKDLVAGWTKAVQTSGQAVLETTQSLVPVRTGELRDSYHLVQEVDQVGVTQVAVETELDYAPPVELGHHTVSGSWVPPRAHLGPAATAEEGRLAGRFTAQ